MGGGEAHGGGRSGALGRAAVGVIVASLTVVPNASAADLPWRSPHRYRLVLRVDPGQVPRSNSPATIDIDLVSDLRAQGFPGKLDETSIEVIAYDHLAVPFVFDGSRRGYERYLLPWRIEETYGLDRVSLHFVVPDETCRHAAVYLETTDCGRGTPRRYPGPVGDGDFLRGEYEKRETGAGHFDAFCDLDGDGDPDLFRGGVEPFIECLENVGRNRLVERGRLTSAGEVLTLPHNAQNGRSWVVPHFFDLDGDGDQDFFPSFMDGPHARHILVYENTTTSAGPLTFRDRGPLETTTGIPLAGGRQAGGWFPSIVFVRDFDGDEDGRLDAFVGSNNRCYLYRNLERKETGGWQAADAVSVRAGGDEIVLFNPCFEVRDIDADGDQDLFAAPQSGEVYYYENVRRSAPGGSPDFAAGVVLAFDDLYLQPSTHPRVTALDFTGDGLIDLVVDRAWELADLRNPSDDRVYGRMLRNAGTATSPKWLPDGIEGGAPHTEGFPICDALRQNVVRAADWNGDGRTDLLAGDCDGHIWYFENRTNHLRPVFARSRKLRAAGRVLSLADHSGHARPDVCDWNGDGRQDLVVADGAGRVTVYLDESSNGEPSLGPGRSVKARDAAGALRPIDRGTRSHVLVADWNADGKKDLVFSDQENPGFYVFKNEGSDTEPRFARPERLGVKPYVRPNLGSFVDWDGDGRKDFVACEFEHSIRLYRNVGSGRPGEDPAFADGDGILLVKPSSIMMISGADVVDWNRDGDLDILTGQGHGGSGIRFFERDAIEDSIRGTKPVVAVERLETSGRFFLTVVRRYADAMIDHGRDNYGEAMSGLFLSALDRTTLGLLDVRPAPPGGVRRGDRAGLPWRRLTGANPQLDENLLRLLYSLSEVTGDERYREAADHEVGWFFTHTQSPVTGLLPWGEHLSWDVILDRPVSSGTDLTHEFARPWALWDRTYELAPEAAARFARGLWHHQIADRKTGAFDRHAPYDRHGPRAGKDFARHGGFYIDTWAHAYRHTGDNTFLTAIETLLARFERKRSGAGGVPRATMGPLDVTTAAALVPEPLASRLKKFAAEEDRLLLEDLDRRHAPDGTPAFVPTWEAAYASGVTADWAMFALARYRQTGAKEFRDLVVTISDAYVDALPDEDVDVWPMSFAHVISAELAAYDLTRSSVYLEEACRLGRLAVRLFWQDRPLPRASLKTDHYETITGADSLALALLELHVAVSGRNVDVPPNTIDR